MKRSKTEEIGNVLDSLINNSKMGTRMNENNAEDTWYEVVDEMIGKLTSSVKVYKGLMTVQFNSPIARQEMMMKRAETIKKINEKLGGEVIKDIFMK